ncbi:MAG: hypothetical protein RI947_526 [Candidatus Parcubacteria bacterium]|jgi:tRNA uridine 5-carbamoylmethylation protein Kti12
MNLIFIYGVPAAGKLTVANELAALTGYKVFHNHAATDFVMSLFPWDHPERRRLTTKFRLEMIEAAAKEGINVIFTYGAVGAQFNEFVSKVVEAVENYKGTVCFVKLMCSKEELLKRVTANSRKQHNKIITAKEIEDKLQEIDYSQEFPQKPSLVIDNTQLSPQETAKRIVTHYLGNYTNSRC